MKVQDWIFTVRYYPEGASVPRRCAIVGPARAATVEAVLHLADVPEFVRAEIRADRAVRKFVEGVLDPEVSGYYASRYAVSSLADWSWSVCIGSIQEVIS